MKSSEFISVAKAQLGVKESPKNSNKCKYNTWFYGKAVSGSAYPWCATFVCWCGYKAGGSAVIPKNCSAAYLQEAIVKAGGSWLMPKNKNKNTRKNMLKKYKAGDVVSFDFGAYDAIRDHIGIVYKVAGNYVYCIEGNTSAHGSQSNGGEVCLQKRPYYYICSAVRPKFSGSGAIDYTIDVDGDWGALTTIATQHVLGTDEDGVMGKQTWKAVQKKVGATVDGEAGTDTYTHMAQFLGICGANTQVNRLTTDLVKAWQKWLNSQLTSSTTTITTTSTTKRKYSGELPNTTVTVTGTCKIGQATSDERGKLKGGKVGDQTGGEVGISKYSYSSKSGVYNHWQFVVRIKSDEGKAKAVKCMKQLCANNNIGYNQKPTGGRSALYKKLKAVNFDGSKVGKVDTSCTPLVEACLRAGGVPIATGSDAAHFKAAAQKCTSKVDILTAGKYLTSSKYLKAGDAICSGKHSAMVVQASTSTRKYLKKGDTGTEIKKLQKFLNWYGYALTIDGDFGSATESAVKKFQKANGLEVDGLWGTACNSKAKEVEK